MSAPDLSPYDVATVQLQLKLTGDYPGLLHGVFDDPTRKALRRFKERERVGEKAGVIDDATHAALDRCAYATFDQQLAIEVDEIWRARPRELKTGASGFYEARQAAHDARLVGLAFSGGGIRSATFNLGVIQALAELKLLHIFDYVSTVSGGGYIGSWLSALITRRGGGIDDIARELCPNAGDPGVPGYSRESQAIRFLRGSSGFVRPNYTALTADTLTAVCRHVSNVSIHLLILSLFLVALLLIPRILVALISAHPGALEREFLWCGLGLLVVPTMAIVGANLAYRTPAAGVSSPWYAQTLSILLLLWVPSGAGAYLIACWFSVQPEPDFGHDLRWWALLGVIFAHVVWMVGGIAYLLAEARANDQQAGGVRSLPTFFWVLLWLDVAGALGGVLFYWFTGVLEYVWITPQHGPAVSQQLGALLGPLVLVSFAALVTFFFLVLAGRIFSEDVHEWFYRMLGTGAIIVIYWLILVSLYIGPPLLSAMTRASGESWIFQWMPVVGLAVIVLAAVIMNGTQPLSMLSGVPLEGLLKLLVQIGDVVSKIVNKFAPWVAVALIVVYIGALISLTIEFVLPYFTGVDTFPIMQTGDSFPQIAAAELSRLQREANEIPPFILLSTALFCATAGVVLSWRADLNRFSLCHFYRNRLTRCYLGATRAPHRQPQPFTGFDPEDDLPLHQLGRTSGGVHLKSQRPYHIVNTALNLVHGVPARIIWTRYCSSGRLAHGIGLTGFVG